MSVPALQYHRIPLPDLGVELPAAYDQAVQLLHFPVATVCAALQLDLKTQRARVNRDYSEYLSKLRLPTAGGPQQLLCIEWAALGMWLATIQDQRTGNEETSRRLRVFRAKVMAAASAILSGRAESIPLEETQRRRGAITLMLQHDTRLAQLEQAVFVGEPLDEDDGRVSRCPHCGGAIQVHARSMFSIEAAQDTD